MSAVGVGPNRTFDAQSGLSQEQCLSMFCNSSEYKVLLRSFAGTCYFFLVYPNKKKSTNADLWEKTSTTQGFSDHTTASVVASTDPDEPEETERSIDTFSRTPESTTSSTRDASSATTSLASPTSKTAGECMYGTCTQILSVMHY